MIIRTATRKDFTPLVGLYRSFFSTHNVFKKSNKAIVEYLKEQAKVNELIICEEGGTLQGALFLVNFGQNADKSHKLWKFRHFAFDSEKIGFLLLAKAEKKVKKSSKTSKIELTIAETEKGIKFYRSKGYTQEGSLLNHYCFGETCYILSKSLFR